MPNKPNLATVVEFPRLNDEATRRYIDGFGVMLEGFGAGATFGRLLGYLLLMPAPVSLDQMARDLEASKSSISVAARQLEQAGMARRLPQRGSRRLLYEAAETSESLIEADNQRRAMFLEKIRQGEQIADSELARRRLAAFADLFSFSIDESRDMLQRWRERAVGREARR
jgi:DNA-binding transcriptional regulator GbsR (MarR family)